MTDRDRVLVVCTGNICRSPYIERVLAHTVPDLDVRSAGTHALVGEPIDNGSKIWLRHHGVRDDGFSAQQLTRPLVQDSDLVLAVTPWHRSQVVTEWPKAMRYTFAVPEFADLVSHVTPADLDPEIPLAGLPQAAARKRNLVRARIDEAAEIADPFQQGAQAFEGMVRQLEQLLPPIIQALRLATQARRERVTSQGRP